MLFFLVLNGFNVAGQTDAIGPIVGQPMPNFTLRNVKYYKDNVITSERLRGKWFIIHFWSLSCGSAIESLDQADAIQKSFGNDLQVILIGHKDGPMNEEGIETVFERKRKTNNYELPIVYDTVLFNKWSINGVPTIYIVNPQGILKYITPGIDLTVKKVKDILDGKKVTLWPKDFKYARTDGIGLFNEKLQYEDITYASVLTNWNGEYPNLGYKLDQFVQLPDRYRKDGWSVSFATLTRLYQYAYYGQGWFFMADTAYYGRVYEKPILEVNDKTPFTEFDFETGKGYYNYFLKLPLDKMTKASIMKTIQHALQLEFGYYAQLEVRQMPIWKLMASPKAFRLLKTQGGAMKKFGRNSVAGVKVRNFPMRDFVRLVTANIPNREGAPFIDNTGIKFRIDANIQTDMTDFESVQGELRKYGLEFVRDTKEMSVLVIRDAKGNMQ